MDTFDKFDGFGRMLKREHKCPFCQTKFYVDMPSTWTPVDEEYKVCTCGKCKADIYKEVHGLYAEKDGIKVVVE